MGERDRYIYVANIPKNADNFVNNFLKLYFPKKKALKILNEYYIRETKRSRIAFVLLGSTDQVKKACTLDQKVYHNRRLTVLSADDKREFDALRTVFVKYVPLKMTEEMLFEVFTAFGDLEYIQFPSDYIAYVMFKAESSAKKAVDFGILNWRNHRLTISFLRRNTAVRLESYESLQKYIENIEIKKFAQKKVQQEIVRKDVKVFRSSLRFQNLGGFVLFDKHSDSEAYVNLIPIEATENEIIDHFEKFGRVIYVKMELSVLCGLCKSADLIFVNKNGARRAYEEYLHNFRNTKMIVQKKTRSRPLHLENRAIMIKGMIDCFDYNDLSEAFKHIGQIIWIQMFHEYLIVVFTENIHIHEAKKITEIIGLKVEIKESSFGNEVELTEKSKKYIYRDGIESFYNGIAKLPALAARRSLSNVALLKIKRLNDYKTKIAQEEERLLTMPLLLTEFDRNYTPLVPKKWILYHEVKIYNCSIDVTLEDLKMFFKDAGTVKEFRSTKMEFSEASIVLVSFETLKSAIKAVKTPGKLLNRNMFMHLASEKILTDRDYCFHSKFGRVIDEQTIYACFEKYVPIDFLCKTSKKSAVLITRKKNLIANLLEMRRVGNLFVRTFALLKDDLKEGYVHMDSIIETEIRLLSEKITIELPESPLHSDVDDLESVPERPESPSQSVEMEQINEEPGTSKEDLEKRVNVNDIIVDETVNPFYQSEKPLSSVEIYKRYLDKKKEARRKQKKYFKREEKREFRTKLSDEVQHSKTAPSSASSSFFLSPPVETHMKNVAQYEEPPSKKNTLGEIPQEPKQGSAPKPVPPPFENTQQPYQPQFGGFSFETTRFQSVPAIFSPQQITPSILQPQNPQFGGFSVEKEISYFNQTNSFQSVPVISPPQQVNPSMRQPQKPQFGGFSVEEAISYFNQTNRFQTFSSRPSTQLQSSNGQQMFQNEQKLRNNNKISNEIEQLNHQRQFIMNEIIEVRRKNCVSGVQSEEERTLVDTWQKSTERLFELSQQFQ